MVVAARIAWIMRQVDLRRKVHIAFGGANDNGKAKVKITVQQSNAGHADHVAASMVRSVLEHLQTSLVSFVAVDRGHRFSNGVSEVSIWLAPIPSKSATPNMSRWSRDAPHPSSVPRNYSSHHRHRKKNQHRLTMIC